MFTYSAKGLFRQDVSRKHSKSFNVTVETLYEFAEEATRRLRVALPYAIADGLFRVDIMMYKDRLVVNEFESFEATYTGVEGVEMFLQTYWERKIENTLILNEI